MRDKFWGAAPKIQSSPIYRAVQRPRSSICLLLPENDGRSISLVNDWVEWTDCMTSALHNVRRYASRNKHSLSSERGIRLRCSRRTLRPGSRSHSTLVRWSRNLGPALTCIRNPCSLPLYSAAVLGICHFSCLCDAPVPRL